MKLIFFILLMWSCKTPIPQDCEFVIHGGAVDLDVKVLITEDVNKALAYVKLNLDSTIKISDFDARGVTFCSQDGKSPIMWVPTAEDLSIVNHELFHATADIMRWASIPYSEDTEEVYAYELQYLSSQFYNHINKEHVRWIH